ncbi:MAG: TonB family protein [Acidobacteria bacterium]|nr:TonB family protein [Acidobacteriota bacterium]
MKRTMLAILAISPVLLHAQAKSPAQPSSTPVLQSSNTQPAAFAAVSASDRDIAAPAPVRISTGVTPPTLIHSVNVDTNHILQMPVGQPQNVTVDMIVDENGKPSNVKVVKSADIFTDRGVVSAVNQYRYKPATLNGSPVPMAVTLQFTIE